MHRHVSGVNSIRAEGSTGNDLSAHGWPFYTPSINVATFGESLIRGLREWLPWRQAPGGKLWRTGSMV